MRTPLLARAEERRAIDEILDGARNGDAAALVLRGEAGMGKTRLFEYASAVQGFRVERIAGVESESEFGFGGLQRLLLPFMSNVDVLPAPQRQALGSALGVLDGDPPDRFIVGLAALSLLADAATTEPLLCIVDDVQWLDRESIDALAFVGRRLHAERIALLFGVRAARADRLPFDGLTAHEVEGLQDDAALELLGRVADGPVDGEVARRIVAETDGCPLAIIELASSLTDAQLGGALPPEPLPMSRRLEAHYQQQMGSLPDDTKLLLVIAAADPIGDPIVLWGAAEALGVSAGAADHAIVEDLVVLSPRIEFRHPLIRSAVYASASSTQRRRAHLALADAHDSSLDPDRRAWHLAAATVLPDEHVAEELEQGAMRSHRRGRYASEAAFWSRAAELTPDAERRAARQLHAAQAHLIAGARAPAKALLAEVRRNVPSAFLEAHAQRLAAALDSFSLPNDVPLVLLEAARTLEPLDAGLARDTYAEALEALLVSGQLTKGTTPVEVAKAALAAPPRPTGEETVADTMLAGFATRFAVGYEEAAPALKSAVRRLATEDVQAQGLSRYAVSGTDAAADLWDADGFNTILRRLEVVERERGALDSLRITLGGLGHFEMWSGNFGVADAYHSEATDIARALGELPTIWEMLKVELYAWQGNDESARRAITALTNPRFRETIAGVTVNLARVASTILELGQGHYAAAFDSALHVYHDDIPPHGSQVLAELVEAGARSGNDEVAAEALERLAARATASGTAWALGLLARSRALLSEGGTAAALYVDAIEHLGATPVRTDLARAHLLHGEWLRREARRHDAREALRTAFDMFVAIGATAFAERARIELAATGETTRRRSVETISDLTAQERQVARMATTGATNKEIGAQLFISDATVDYHLRKVYRKLGLTSRRQLRDDERV